MIKNPGYSRRSVSKSNKTREGVQKQQSGTTREVCVELNSRPDPPSSFFRSTVTTALFVSALTKNNSTQFLSQIVKLNKLKPKKGHAYVYLQRNFVNALYSDFKQ